MDWHAFAAALAEEIPEPVIALARDGRIRFVNRAAEELLGGTSCELLSRDFAERCADPHAARLDAVLEGAARRLHGELVTVDGRHLDVRAGASAVLVEERLAVIVLRVESAIPLRLTTAGERRSLDYAVSIDPRDFGTLVPLAHATAVDGYVAGQRCWELVGRRDLCPDCPLRHDGEPWPRTAVRRRGGAAGCMELVQARLVSSTLAEVSVRTIDASTFTRMFETRVSGIAQDADLSPREAAVFRYLVMGRSLDDVATIMDITKRTVKHHQSNVLRKLGADSRGDLVRLVM
jgi:PAS domain S-box-containing protein